MNLIFTISHWTFLYGFSLFVASLPLERLLKKSHWKVRIGVPTALGLLLLVLYGDLPGTLLYFSLILFYCTFYHCVRGNLYYPLMLIRELRNRNLAGELPTKRAMITWSENAVSGGTP